MAYRQATKLGSSAVTSTVQDIGSVLARQAETAGERLHELATAFRDALPRNGAAALMSEGLESARGYLGDRELRDLGRDLGDFIRRYRLQAILLGAGVVGGHPEVAQRGARTAHRWLAGDVLAVDLGREAFRVSRGMRIAQFVIAPVVRVAWEEVGELPTTARAAGGFGHSGV